MEAVQRRVVKVRRGADGDAVPRAQVAKAGVEEAPLPELTSIDQFEVLGEIGRTELACVFKAVERTTGRVVALKQLNKQILCRLEPQVAAATRRAWRTECKTHSKLKHPFIVELFAVFEDADHKYLVMEYCANGDMSNYFGSSLGLLSEEVVSYYIKQASLALAYLHRHDPTIIHRDLKLENCLIDADGNLKLADFGSVGVLLNRHDRRGTLCGTLDYLAPEFLNREGMGHKADVWAVGVMAYEMLVGQAPFAGYGDQASTCDAIVHAEVDIPAHLTPDCKDFLSTTLNRDESFRLTMEQVCYHPFLTNYHANFYYAPPAPPMCQAP